MSTNTHDNLCDWQPCLMCQETTPCCPDCDNDPREFEPLVRDFEDDWERAPSTNRRLVTMTDAEYWWLRGKQAGRIAEQVETQKWMQQMIEGYGERVGR